MIQLPPFELNDVDPADSEKLTEILNAFSSGLAEVYSQFQLIRNRAVDFKNVMLDSMARLVSDMGAAADASTGLKISGYKTPDSSTNILHDPVYGQLTLEQTSTTSHIPLIEDELGDMQPSETVTIFLGKTESNLVESRALRPVLGTGKDIWTVTLPAADTDGGYVWIALRTPAVLTDLNYVTVYPLAGTLVDTIKVYESNPVTFVTNTTRPVKIHQSFPDFQHEVRIKLQGVDLGDGTYRFAIYKIEVCSATYATEGSFTYTTADNFDTISTLVVNAGGTYIYPSTSRDQRNQLIIKLYNTYDETVPFYDSTSGALIPQNLVPSGYPIKMVCTLKQDEGTTPFIRTII